MSEKNVNLNTHQWIQAVLASKGITLQCKMVLIHCLEKYQSKDAEGKPYTFSNRGIQTASGLAIRTIERITKALAEHNVMKRCGSMRFNSNQDRPTTLFYFNPEGLEGYLQVNDKLTFTYSSANTGNTDTLSIKEGQVNDKVNVRVNDKVNVRVNVRADVIEEDNRKKTIEEEGRKKILERTITKGTGSPSGSVLETRDTSTCPKGSPSVLVENKKTVSVVSSRDTSTCPKGTVQTERVPDGSVPKIPLTQMDEQRCRQSSFTHLKKFWSDLSPAEKAELIQKELPGKYY